MNVRKKGEGHAIHAPGILLCRYFGSSCVHGLLPVGRHRVACRRLINVELRGGIVVVLGVLHAPEAAGVEVQNGPRLGGQLSRDVDEPDVPHIGVEFALEGFKPFRFGAGISVVPGDLIGGRAVKFPAFLGLRQCGIHSLIQRRERHRLHLGYDAMPVHSGHLQKLPDFSVFRGGKQPVIAEIILRFQPAGNRPVNLKQNVKRTDSGIPLGQHHGENPVSRAGQHLGCQLHRQHIPGRRPGRAAVGQRIILPAGAVGLPIAYRRVDVLRDYPAFPAAEEGQLQQPGVLVALHHVHPGHDRLPCQVYFQFVFDIHHVNPLSPEGGNRKIVAQKKATQRKNPSALLKTPYQSAVSAL